ncbi:SDR family oxidoreductase [Weissella bombi]|uniref:3-oxoacyl-[acyl-carrier-protein] reductase n=1 Tax=Weissella bombi TaxID=1505725 RepID=A0A1C3YTE7_9LACO|nr:SDR family oxidoreductase [Weissella bombi]SCB73377.1 3-oxoacyl-[acyl-carrier-protein] reductase [Weissella bombi]
MSVVDTQRTILITGASSGIGLAVAKKFDEENVQLILHSHSPIANEILSKFKNPVINIVFDVLDDEIIKLTFKKLQLSQTIDVLVNSAGINIDKLFVQMSNNEFDKVLSTNFMGTSKVIEAALPLFKTGSMIINIASVIGLSGNIGQTNYAASKDATLALTKYLAEQYAKKGILVNAVSPGMIKTKMTDGMTEKMRNYAESIIPLKRFGTPEEVAELVNLLSKMTYVTGQNFIIDGGLYMT